MAEGERTLLLTRPEPQSRAFLADCEARMGRELPSVISPVLRIVPLDFSRDPGSFATVIVTSSNAVASVGSRLAGAQVVTVGEKTAERARAAGAEARCLGDTVDGLLARIGEVAGPALYLRGAHTRGHLAERARAAGVMVEEAVVYDQEAVDLSGEAQALLFSGQAVVPLFSPRSASLVGRYPASEETRLVAISEATAEAWTGPGVLSIAERPDGAAMVAAVTEAF